MIQIKTEDEIALMREAGLVVGRTLEKLKAAVAPGMTTADLDAVAEAAIRGDGAIVEGYHGDAAVTVPVGDVEPARLELLRVTEESLWRGIAGARLGGRLIEISRAIEGYIRSQPHPGGGKWGIVEEYVGHGIGTEMHQDPQVYNYVGRRMPRGPELVKGLALAVEPMVNLGSRATRVLDDGWTVVTDDGAPSAHFEHTFTLTERGPWVLTALDGGEAKLAELGALRPSA
jgi:methionyl aminopeptidase